MIEISENKLEKISGLVEEVLRASGKLMQCIDEFRDDDRSGYMEGGDYGERNYGNRMGESSGNWGERRGYRSGNRYR